MARSWLLSLQPGASSSPIHVERQVTRSERFREEGVQLQESPGLKVRKLAKAKAKAKELATTWRGFILREFHEHSSQRCLVRRLTRWPDKCLDGKRKRVRSPVAGNPRLARGAEA